MPKPVLQVELVEVTDHVIRLLLTVVDLLDPVEDHHQDDLVRHDARLLVEVLVALLNPFYGRFQHVFRLAIHAHAYRQLDFALVRLLKQGDEPVPGRIHPVTLP